MTVNDDEASDRTGNDPEHSRLAADHPFHEHPRESSRRSGKVRDQHGHRRRTIRGDGRACVESEPAHPQQGTADEGEHYVVRGKLGSSTVGATLANNHRGHEARHSGRDMHDVAASKIEHAPVTHKAPAPLPVAKGAVNKEMPEEDEDKQGTELHPLSDSSGDDGSSDDGKRHLKDHKERLGHGAAP